MTFLCQWSAARPGGLGLLVILGILGSPSPVTAFQGCSTEWISTPGGGQPAFGDSFNSALSTDGRFVAFDSGANNLVPGDTNGKADVFVVDRQLGTIERVSVSTAGLEGNGHALFPDLSGDGRFVVFVSASTNLDPGDTHPSWDIYLRDRLAQTTQLISAHLSPPIKPNYGGSEPRISPDGRFVAFSFGEDIIVPGDSNGWSDVFLRDMSTGVTELISVSSIGVQSNLQSYAPAISADGRFVAFVSEASNWYPGYTPGPVPRNYAYVRDRQLGTLFPVNLNSAGTLGPGYAGSQLDLSADGRFLVYLYSLLGDFADQQPIGMTSLYVRDLVTGATQSVDYSVFGNNGSPSQYILVPSNPSISADGRFIAFESRDDELVLHSGNTMGFNVFIHDRLTGLSQAAGLGPNGQWPSLPPQRCAEAFFPSISSDGRSVSFSCEDPSFGSGNAFYNIYVRTCDWTQPQVYCDSQVSSLSCRPGVTFTGSPSASAGSGFIVEVQGLVSATTGLLMYSTGRPVLMPFQGSYLCMEPPVRRMPLQPTGGSQTPNCTGSLSVDFNAWIAGGGDPTLVAGENACVQAWSADRGAASKGNLSNALVFAIGP